MPTLHLRVAPLQSPERHALLACALTDLTAQVLHKRREVTAVVIDELPAARWSVGGHAPQQPTAWLEISITAGTNTAEEKAHFIALAHAELQRQLAPGGVLEEASYITVRELPASDWGYGGHTQAARRAQVAAA